MSIPMLRDRSSQDEVDVVRKPGRMARDDKEMLVVECVTDVSAPGMWRRDKWSATEFLLPFLSLISKSNS